MALIRLTPEEKKELTGKVEELAKSEKISIREACKRLDTPYWKYFNSLKSMKKGKKTTGKKAPAALKSTSAGELKVELVFKGNVAEQVREYAEAYGVEPEVVCRIMVIDGLKEKK
jgi:DNA replication initiation complex subunit (GINS family)